MSGSSTPSSPPRAEGATAGERIAKRIARAGLCSRREAETWVLAGRVTVDGKKLASPAFTVGPQSKILVDGKPLPTAEAVRLFRYHKPDGLSAAARDPYSRATIYDKLPADLPRVMPVGPLDPGAEGLLLLTNDGELKRRLELPATGWLRRYRVRVRGRIDPTKLAALADGVKFLGTDYGPVRATLDRQQGENAWLTISLAEGRNRDIRRLCEHFGWPVSRLIRLAYGPFQLGQLPRGGIEEVPPKVLREQLGIKSARQPSHAAAAPALNDAHRRGKA